MAHQNSSVSSTICCPNCGRRHQLKHHPVPRMCALCDAVDAIVRPRVKCCRSGHCLIPAQLLDDPRLAAELCPEARHHALSALTACAAMIAALRPTTPEQTPRSSDDFTLNADDVAARLDKSRRWVFRQASRLPFVRRISRKTLLASESGLNRWIAARRSA